MVPLKCEVILVLSIIIISNIAIAIFDFSLLLLIKVSPLIFFFWFNFFASFLYFHSIVITLPTIPISLVIFKAFKGDSDTFFFSIAFALKRKGAATIDLAIVKKAITKRIAIQKRNHESMYKIDTVGKLKEQ